MPLTPPAARRSLKHTRTITIEAFAREDGLWDIDANITDIKPHDTQLATSIRPANAPIHDLWLRVTINADLTIVDAEAASDAMPYPGECNNIGPAYKKLIGLNLAKGIRHGLKEHLSGVAGCTHLTELAQVLPTAALQAVSGQGFYKSKTLGHAKPLKLGQCHALRLDGAAVARYYPEWALAPDNMKMPD